MVRLRFASLHKDTLELTDQTRENRGNIIIEISTNDNRNPNINKTSGYCNRQSTVYQFTELCI